MDLKIGIGKDLNGWHLRFLDELSLLKIDGINIISSLVDLDDDQFIDNVSQYEVILWKPSYMGNLLASNYKEKVYFMENFLGKVVFPSFKTIWHFESKIAESYIFNHGKIPTPKTYSSFNYWNAKDIIEKLDFPLVLKNSEGAGSKNVKLIKSKKKLLVYIQRVFCRQLWIENRKIYNLQEMAMKKFYKKWFWFFISSQFIRHEFDYGVVYFQEFIPNNSSDLRITMIGDKYAYGFWRINRPNDFRASGSGLIDYTRKIPFEVLRFCQSINIRYGFDSMAYDILFNGNDFFINEMSYGYKDQALFNAQGYYVFDNEIQFVQGHTWPQALWVKALIEKISNSK